MKVFMVAMRDIKTNTFGPAMAVNHLELAIRSFGDQCKGDIGNDKTMALHPEDFELYQLGIYNDETGEFTNEKQQIAVGSNFKRA